MHQNYAHMRCERLDSRFPVVTHRYLSPSIALKRNFLAVDMTVNAASPERKSRTFKWLYVPETIEWE